MTRYSIKETHVLKYLIINCKIWDLNETESLRYIGEKFGKVSRRTFYNYKKRILEVPHQKVNRFIYSEHTNFNSSIRKRYYLKTAREVIRKSSDITDLQIQNYDNFGGIPTSFNKVMLSSSRFIEESKIFIRRIEKETELRNKRTSQIPLIATLREEFVSCNKKSCKWDKHGPYLYAYWRDSNSKIKKKYIGKI